MCGKMNKTFTISLLLMALLVCLSIVKIFGRVRKPCKYIRVQFDQLKAREK